MADEKKDTIVDYYEGIITAYDRAYKSWQERASKIVKRYRDEQRARQDNDQTKFNILWSNVNTLVPATYSRTPQADVGRRFRDQDPVGRVASLILERALTFEIEQYPDYRATMRQAVQDRFLPGRGTAWARYEPHFKAADQIPEDGLQVTEDIDEAEQPEQIDYECAPTDYVPWKDFGHNVARTWEEVFCVWRIVYLFEEAVEERFGKDVAKTLAYDATPESTKKEISTQDAKKQAKIYEIWDKQTQKVIWISKEKKEPLDKRDDPLGLQEFFPSPRPLYATTTNESLIPVPDFALYQDQARELDILANRIDGLVRMLQVKGCYDASTPELARLFTEGVNGTMIPIKNFAAFAERKGLDGAIDLVDLQPIYEALKVAFEATREIVNLIYQITGISDIVRGQTEAGETLGAQQLKVNFVGLRLGDMKRDVARFATDCLQLKAQIMCQHYSPQTIMAMAAVEQLSPADKQLIPQAMVLLLGEKRMQDPQAESPNPLRSFRIEVNADSLIQVDEQGEQDAAKEFLGGISRFLESAGQIGMASPQMVPVLMELMKWSLTKFKVGKTIEGTIDAALEQMKIAAQQPKPLSPEEMKAQADAQKNQQQAQLDQQKAAHEQQLSQVEEQRQQMVEAAKHEREQQQIAADAALEKQRMEYEARLEEIEAKQKIKFEEWKAKLDAATKIEVAEIQAEAKAETASVGEDGEKPKRTKLSEKLGQLGEQHAESIKSIMEILNGMREESSAPIELQKGSDGRISTIKKGGKVMKVIHDMRGITIQ